MTLAHAATITGALAEGRRRISVGDLEYQRQIGRLYRMAFENVLNEMDAFSYYVSRRKLAGEVISPSWLSRQVRYISLQSQFAAAAKRFGIEVQDLIEASQQQAVRFSLQGLHDEVWRATGAPGPLRDLGGFGAATWANVDKAAFEAAASMIQLNRSPLRQLLLGMDANALLAFNTAFMNGIALGRNPRKIARDFRSHFQGITQGRAQMIARTEWMRATHSARSEAFTKSAVVKAWIWRCAMDRRSCGLCYSMHGTEHPTTEPMASHPNCRCVMIPKTVDWSELGLPGIPNTRPPIEPGASQFRRLTKAEQQRLIGKARSDLFDKGVKLRDMIHVVPNSTWGPMTRWKPLTQTPGAPKAPPLTKFAGIDFGSLPQGRAAYSMIADITKKLGVQPHEAGAVNFYQGGSYREFNQWARGLLRPGAYTHAIDSFKVHMDAMKTLFARASTKESVMVWRGMNTATQSIKVGSSFVDNAPGSTSTSRSVAEAFASGSKSQPVILHIYVPAGSKALTADEAGGWGGMQESEVLLAPGSRYRVIRRIGDFSMTVGKTVPYRTIIVPQYEVVVETP